MSTALVEPPSPGASGRDRPGPVDWSLAARVAKWLIARRSPGTPFDTTQLTESFAAATARAEVLVSASTGWHVPTAARSVVVDRAGWAGANVASFERLLGPVVEKFDRARNERRDERRRSESRPAWAVELPEPISQRVAGVGRSASGAQLGAVLAWMSTRVLGQYDLLLCDEHGEAQDIVYYVGSNVVDIEARYGFSPDQFRLWLALHEVTHRYQFTAVPWLRDHFLSLVDRAIEPIHADPGKLADLLRRASTQLRARERLLDDAGLLGLVASASQLDAIRGLQSMMSLLEGHGDVIMDRAGAGEVPDAPEFSRVLRERRQSVKGPAKVLQQVLGIEAKLRQYRQGEVFIHEVERRGGPELFSRVWEEPASLPTLAEIRQPQLWVERIGETSGPA